MYCCSKFIWYRTGNENTIPPFVNESKNLPLRRAVKGLSCGSDCNQRHKWMSTCYQAHDYKFLSRQNHFFLCRYVNDLLPKNLDCAQFTLCQYSQQWTCVTKRGLGTGRHKHKLIEKVCSTNNELIDTDWSTRHLLPLGDEESGKYTKLYISNATEFFSVFVLDDIKTWLR